MLRRISVTGWMLVLGLLGLVAFAAGCASPTLSGTSTPAGQPTLLFFYTDT